MNRDTPSSLSSSIAGSIVLLLIAMTSIQFGAAGAKRLFPLIGAEATTMLRIGFAALMLLALWRPWGERLTRERVAAIAIYGAALGCMNLAFYLAIARIPLGVAVAIEFTGPLAIAILASRRPLDFVWALLAAAGIVLILPLRQTEGALDPLGVFLAFVAGACWALYIVAGQRLSRRMHEGRAAAWGMFVAALTVLPAGARQATPRLLDPEILLAGLAVALLSSAIPYSLEMVALKRVPSRTFGILMSLEPALAALSGFALLGERLTPAQWGAIACVIAASAGSAVTARDG